MSRALRRALAPAGEDARRARRSRARAVGQRRRGGAQPGLVAGARGAERRDKAVGGGAERHRRARAQPARAAPPRRRRARGAACRARRRASPSTRQSAPPARGRRRRPALRRVRPPSRARARGDDHPLRRPRSSASLALRSSITANSGGTPASSGKRRNSDWQKAWIVAILVPPGRSSTRAKSCRARAISSSSRHPPGQL